MVTVRSPCCGATWCTVWNGKSAKLYSCRLSEAPVMQLKTQQCACINFIHRRKQYQISVLDPHDGGETAGIDIGRTSAIY